MPKIDLMKKLEAVVDEMARGRIWGTLQVDFQNGEATMLRKTLTEKLPTDEGNRRGSNSNYNR